MNINRKELRAAFRSFALGGSCIVIGQPGVGKSFLLKQFVSELMQTKQICVFIPIDKIGVENDADLKTQLDIKGNFIEYLRAQNPSSEGGKALLVIDAFDAARSEQSQRFFARLIKRVREQLNESWSVIVSVRTYDARKSEELQVLFPESPSEVIQPKFRLTDIRCRHFYVPILDPEEVSACADSIPHLPDIYTQGSADFRELLRVPFNLWLLQKILASGRAALDFTSVSSEVQLLGMFWNQRVIDGPFGNDRQFFLTKVCRELVEQRALSVRTEDVYILGQGMVWESLFSAELLLYTSNTKQRLAFSHNILFDYAVSVLLIEDDPQKLVHFITSDISRPVFLRPSLHYYLVRIWHSDAQLFWNTLWYLLAPNKAVNLRLFARLLPAGVVATETRHLTELNPLLKALHDGSPLAVEATLRILQAHRAFNVIRDELWIEAFHALSTFVRREFAWDLAMSTMAILERYEPSHDNELTISTCGKTGRNILSWVWRERKRAPSAWIDKLGGNFAVPLVARTFRTDLGASRALLLKILELLTQDEFPIEYVYRLTSLVDKIWMHDPKLVSSIYLSIFSHQETSQKRTYMGGVVMPLSSTRRQDFEMSQHNLAEHFGSLLKVNPLAATKMVIQILNDFIQSEHVVPYLKNGFRLEGLVRAFSFRGKSAQYLADLSYIWDQRDFEDSEIRMANALFAYLEELETPADLDSLLDVFAETAVCAFLWRRLLGTASKKPKVFAASLLDLCLSPPVQTGAETIRELGEFLEKAATAFSPHELSMIEESILRLDGGDIKDTSQIEYLDHARNRLLARIPAELLSTTRGKTIRDQIEKSRSFVTNDPLVSFSSSSREVTDDMWLARQGIDVARPENVELRTHFDSLEAFTTDWFNEKPTPTAIKLVIDSARNLYRILKEGLSNADSAVLNTGWTKVASVAQTMARSIGELGKEELEFCKNVLLDSAVHELPLPDPDHDKKYSSPSWSSAPRVEAARGLPWLGARVTDDRILEAIENLANDKVPAVRFLATSELFRIRVNSPDRFWNVMRELSQHEENTVVLQALCSTLSRVLPSDEAKSVEVLERLADRLLKPVGDNNSAEHLIPLIMWLVLERENVWATETMKTLLGRPIASARMLKRATLDALGYVTPSRLYSLGTNQISNRAIAWLQNAIDAASNGVRQLRLTPAEQWNDKIYSDLRAVYGIIDEIIMRLCFSADVLEHLRGTGRIGRGTVSDDERKNYYFQIKPILERVLKFALDKENGVMFGPTAHHFMQLLNGVLAYDPAGVLHMAACVAKSSEPSNYNLDSLAVQEVTKLVESLLADYRVEVRDGQPLDDLLTLLDIFSSWPESLRLVWRLDEVFR